MKISNMPLNSIWSSILAELEKTIEDHSFYSQIIRPTSLISLKDNTCVIQTDSSLNTRLLEQKKDEIVKAINKITESNYSLEIVTKSNTPTELVEKKKRFFENSSLSKKFTFENFVVGNSNSQAYNASHFVSLNQGKYNPLFIYAKSGLGKTHLLNAIGNEVLKINPEKKVLYISTDDFISEFIRYVRLKNSEDDLKDFFRNIDYLLIDDIQQLTNKRETELMFFNIFNLLIKANKQIVLTSDCPPQLLSGLEDRLVSRFRQGLSLQIIPPEKNTLIEILKMKIASSGFDPNNFEEEALDYLASTNGDNIRALEGSLNRILLFNISIANNTSKITKDIVANAFNNEIETIKKGEKLTTEKIIDVVSDYFNLPASQLTSAIRTSQIALARSIAMYLARTILNEPYTSIAASFNKKDHTSVIASMKKVNNLLKNDENTKKVIKTLTNKIKH